MDVDVDADAENRVSHSTVSSVGMEDSFAATAKVGCWRVALHYGCSFFRVLPVCEMYSYVSCTRRHKHHREYREFGFDFTTNRAEVGEGCPLPSTFV